MASWLLVPLLFTLPNLQAQDAGTWYAVTAEGSAPVPVNDGAAVAVNDQVYLLGGYSRQPVMRFNPLTERWTRAATDIPNLHHFQPVVVGAEVYLMGAYTNSTGRERSQVDILAYNPSTDQLRTAGQMPSGRARGAAGAVVHDGSVYVAGGSLDKEAASVAWFDRYDPAAKRWTRLPDAPRPRDHFQAHVVGDRLYLVGGATNGVPAAAVDVYDLSQGKWLSGAALPQHLPSPRSQAASAVLDGEIYLIGGQLADGRVSELVSVLDPATGTWRETASLIRGRRSAGAAVLNDRIYVAAGVQSADAERVPVEETYLEFFALGDIGRRPFDDWAALQRGNHLRSEGAMVRYGNALYWFNGFRPNLEQQPFNEKYDLVTDSWSPISQIPDAPDGSIQYGTHTAFAVIDSSVWFAGIRIGTGPGLVQNVVWIYDIPSDNWRKGPELPMPTGAGGLARVGDEIHYIGGFDEFVGCEVDYHWVYDLKHPGLGWQDHTMLTPMPMARLHFGTVVVGTKIYVVGGQFGHEACLQGKNVSLVHAFDTETDTWTRLADMPADNSHFEPGIFAYNDKIYRVGGQDFSSQDTWEYDIATDTWTVRPDLYLPERLIATGARPFENNLYISLGGYKQVNNPRDRVWVKSFDPLTSYRLALHPATASPAAFAAEGQRLVLANYASEEGAEWALNASALPAWLGVDRAQGTAIQSGTELVVKVDSSGLPNGTYAYDLAVSAPGYAPAHWSVSFAVTGSGVVDPPPSDTTVVDPPPSDTTVVDPPPSDTTVVDPPPTDTTVVDPPPTDTTVVDPPVDTMSTEVPLSRFYEAECAQVGAKWLTGSDPLAGSGAYVVITRGYQSLESAPPDLPENYVRFRIEVPRDSTYYIQGRLNAPSRNADSYWFRIDGGSWEPWYRDVVTHGTWAWREIPNGPFALTAGEHLLDLAYREKNTELDRLFVSPDNTVPEGVGEPDADCGQNSPEMAIASPQDASTGKNAATVAWGLFPNPTGDYVNVRLPDPATGYKSLTVSDVNGRVVRQLGRAELDGQPVVRIELGALPAGLYRVRLLTDHSDSSRTFVRVY